MGPCLRCSYPRPKRQQGTFPYLAFPTWLNLDHAHVCLLCLQIQWPFDDAENYPEMYIVSVDGIHCRIHEPRTEPSTGWYSAKYNKAGLAYEIAIAIHHNKVVWINGPFPAGQNDKKIFPEPDGLMSKILPGKKVIADEGYRGEPDIVATRNNFDSKFMKKFKGRAKARHESFNSRLKAFHVISEPFRGHGDERMEKHKAVFEACCVIVQYEMDNGHPLFDV